MNFLEILNDKLGVVVSDIINDHLIVINEDTYFEQIITFAELIEMFERCES